MKKLSEREIRELTINIAGAVAAGAILNAIRYILELLFKLM